MNLTLKERLDLQRTARIITESQYNKLLKEEFLFEDVSDEDIKQAVATALKISPEQVATQEPSEDEIDESVVGTVATALTIAGLVPAIMKPLGSIINWTKEKIGLNDEEKIEFNKLTKLIIAKEKYIKNLDKKNSPKEDIEREKLEKLLKQKDELFGAKAGNWLKQKAHWLHDKYTIPIRKILQMIAWTYEVRCKKTILSDEKVREKCANIIYSAIMIWASGYGVIEHIKHLTGVGPILSTIVESLKAGKSLADVIKDALLLI